MPYITDRIKTAYNSTFAIGGVSCSEDSFVVAESSVLRMNICGEKPAHRKSAKRWGKMPQQAGTSRNSRFAQLDNGAKHPLVSSNLKRIL